MKFKNIVKGLLIVILTVGVTGYIAYALLNMTGGDPSEVCTDVTLTIEDNQGEAFITTSSINKLLQAEGLYPKGKLMRDIDTRKIEETLLKNNFLRKAECFKTNNGMAVGKGRVCIKVTQRTPVVYVMPDGGESYYVDTEGIVIPNTVYARNIIIATGKISQDYACSELRNLGNRLLNNPLWDKLIEQVHIDTNRRGEHTATIIPRIGDYTISLGTLDRLDAKMRRLQIFYEQGLPQVGWNKYKHISLEYDNQVVCTK